MKGNEPELIVADRSWSSWSAVDEVLLGFEGAMRLCK